MVVLYAVFHNPTLLGRGIWKDVTGVGLSKVEQEIDTLLAMLDTPNVCVIRGGVNEFATCHTLREGIYITHKKSCEGVPITLAINTETVPHIQLLELWKRLSDATD